MTTATRRWRVGPAIGGAVAMATVMSIGRFAYTPILPSMVDNDGLTTAAAGWVASANYFGYLIGSLSSGPVARAIGLRATLRTGLIASVVTTAAMAAPSHALPWAGLRLLSGVASGWVMVAAASLVLATSGSARRRASDVMFAGVGLGIVVSTLVIAAFAASSDRPEPMWLALGGLAAIGGLIADAAIGGIEAAPPPSLRRTARTSLPPGVRRLVASYACSGFGYVITATYLVLIVRESDLGRALEFTTWCVVGAFGAVSTWWWNRIGQAWDERLGLAVANALQATGVVVVAFFPDTAGVLIGAALLGGTFVGITGVGVDLSRRMHPIDPTRAIAVMTSAFAIGQMIGPAVGGWLADATGSFRASSVLAAAVLLTGGAVLLVRPANERTLDTAGV